MTWDVITKRPEAERSAPNLRDYDAAREAFTWKAVRAELAMPGGLNIVYHALDRHIAKGRGDKLALRWLGKNGEKRDISYSDLSALSNRFANLLRHLGVGPRDRVFSLLGRVPSSMLRHSAHCATAVSSHRCSRRSAPSRCALTNGVTMIVDEAEFDAERWYYILQEERVTAWYTAPTAIRMLMKTGEEVVQRYDLSRLRFLASVGEPLNREAVVWSDRVYGRPFHDNDGRPRPAAS